ncbi:uncharacterized protein [Argopecten irradians]|uniref:uncharacterized protein n=1 Tax=Argopecten irradians TaxID=31199 RepID=UPI003723C3EC
MKPVYFSNLSYVLLNKTNLVTPGGNVSCSVRSRTTARGLPGLSVKSAEIFIGIKVLTPYITIKRGESGVIRLQPTVPIGCFPKNSNCQLSLNLIRSNKYFSQGIVLLETTNCGATIHTENSTAVLEIAVVVEEDNGRAMMAKTFDAVFRTDLYLFHAFWSEYTLPVIKIHVNDVRVPNGVCTAYSGVYMMTFDQRPYKIQSAGDFIMYKHTEYQIQVQIRIRTCHHGSPYCIWGVAVQAGRDVFVIDKTMGMVDFSVCSDSVLDVRREGTTTYRIYTPIGTRIDVSMAVSHLTVKIYPSVRDMEKSEGLCGTLISDCTDDFRMGNNAYFHSLDTAKTCNAIVFQDYNFKPRVFSNSWIGSHVPGAVNLFNLSSNLTSLQPWRNDLRRCHCDAPGGKLQREINCTSGMVSTHRRIERSEIKISTCRNHNISGEDRFKRNTTLNKIKRDLYHHTKKKNED